MSVQAAPLIDQLRQAFFQHHGVDPDAVAAAPGRFNLMGEHTDYNGGLVLPMAIDQQTVVAARLRTDGMVRVVAGDLGSATATFHVGDGPTSEAGELWSNYVRGMATLMHRSGMPISGADLVVIGDMPRGAGLSSSAALENAVGLALATLVGQPDISRVELAKLGQAAEHEFAGCNCGIMDQLVSAAAVAGHALLIDCQSLEQRPVALPEDAQVVIVHSGVERGLVDGAYNERRAQCEQASLHFGVDMLRSVTAEQVDGAMSAGLDPVALRRARHVVRENDRVMAMVDTMAAGDFERIGDIMAASHASLRDDFDVSVPAVDRLVALMQGTIGSHGGARMTGGGFGGAVVAMCHKSSVDALVAAVCDGYRTPAGATPLIMLPRPAAGARVVFQR